MIFEELRGQATETEIISTTLLELLEDEIIAPEVEAAVGDAIF